MEQKITNLHVAGLNNLTLKKAHPISIKMKYWLYSVFRFCGPPLASRERNKTKWFKNYHWIGKFSTVFVGQKMSCVTGYKNKY